MLKTTQQELENLEMARPKTYVLDDHTVIWLKKPIIEYDCRGNPDRPYRSPK